MDFFTNKKIIVTGGRGFLGKPLVTKLSDRGAEVFVPTKKEFDLRSETEVAKMFKTFTPDIVIHAAVNGGGIGYTRTHPGEVFYDNSLMNTFMVEYSRRANVEKFVGVGTVCSYPKFSPVPFSEDDLWSGYPEETNGSYGLSKKMMLVQTQAYREQYNFNGLHMLVVNLYGPGDDFSLETSHVIPAMIRKCIEAQKNDCAEIVCWGDGSPTREFLYVEDAADAIVLATERFNGSEPINLGTGEDISIKDLAHLIGELTGFHGEFKWDSAQPNGQPKRKLDVSRAEKAFGFRAKMSFREGLSRTIEWYKKEIAKEKGF